VGSAKFRMALDSVERKHKDAPPGPERDELAAALEAARARVAAASAPPAPADPESSVFPLAIVMRPDGREEAFL
jgi:hypothetical protein